MSLDIRYLTNGKKEIIRVRNAGVKPTDIKFYEKVEDVPKSIRHYVPEKPTFALPDSAYLQGCGEILYPNLPKCKMEKYKNDRCIAENCSYWGKESNLCNYKGADQ